ncbi:hypothetical protein D3C78_1979660 [compost metagenome]
MRNPQKRCVQAQFLYRTLALIELDIGIESSKGRFTPQIELGSDVGQLTTEHIAHDGTDLA